MHKSFEEGFKQHLTGTGLGEPRPASTLGRGAQLNAMPQNPSNAEEAAAVSATVAGSVENVIDDRQE